MLNRRLLRVRDHFKDLKQSFQELLTSRALWRSCPFRAAPQLGNGDRGKPDLVIRVRAQPRVQIQLLTLGLDDHIRCD